MDSAKPDHKNQAQLGGVILDVAHVLQKQLCEADFTPAEPATLTSHLVRQSFQSVRASQELEGYQVITQTVRRH